MASSFSRPGAVDQLIGTVKKSAAQTVPLTVGASFEMSLTVDAHTVQLVEVAAQ